MKPGKGSALTDITDTARGEVRPAGKPDADLHPLDALELFRSAIVHWFDAKGRDYPWRRTRDPYRILVSELMLQQTRVETVLQRKFYGNWLERFPDLATLATASEDEVLKAWEGLGYYQRARHLQMAARVIVERHGGIFPRALREVRALPGVGSYTAGALLAFAYNEPVAMVDGNVARVLARLLDYRGPVNAAVSRRQLEEWSRMLVDPGNARAFQSGLMELGQTVCLPRNPSCGHCPVARFCQTRFPETLPVKGGTVKTERVDEWVLWLRQGSRIYLEREEGSRRRGLWRLPAVAGETRGEELLRTRYPITRYQVTMHVIRATASDQAERTAGRWFGEAELASLAMAAPDRRAVEQLLQQERQGDFWVGNA